MNYSDSEPRVWHILETTLDLALKSSNIADLVGTDEIEKGRYGCSCRNGGSFAAFSRTFLAGKQSKRRRGGLGKEE